MISLISFLFVILLNAVENAVIPADDMDNRILGGEDAWITEFPSMVSMVTVRTTGQYGCGGTIIDDRWILTAAHCVDRALGIYITVGSENIQYGGSIYRASRIIKHNEFTYKIDNGTLLDVQNDIALLEVEEPFPLNNFTIKAARLPLEDEDTPAGSTVTVIGWGLIEGNQETNILQKVNLEIIDRQQCKRDVRPVTIDRRNLCYLDSREGKRACEGDSGGPVFYNGVVVGINSFGNANCTRTQVPSVSSSVAYFRSWIKHSTGI